MDLSGALRAATVCYLDQPLTKLNLSETIINQLKEYLPSPDFVVTDVSTDDEKDRGELRFHVEEVVTRYTFKIDKS